MKKEDALLLLGVGMIVYAFFMLFFLLKVLSKKKKELEGGEGRKVKRIKGWRRR